MKILLVEDDKKLSLAMTMRLKSNGYTVQAAPDAITAMSSAIAFSPDVVVIDINLPGGNGFTVAERLKTSVETSSIPFLFMTASKNPELQQKATELGAIGFLEKPFYPASLVELIDTCEERR